MHCPVTRPGEARNGEPDAALRSVRRGSEILANDVGGELRIHGTDGQVRDQRTIAPGNDPYPSKG
jgi:hypothetical protein